jgi:hypothetical protein
LWPDGAIARSIRGARTLRRESGCRPGFEAQGGPTGCPSECLRPFLIVCPGSRVSTAMLAAWGPTGQSSFPYSSGMFGGRIALATRTRPRHVEEVSPPRPA